METKSPYNFDLGSAPDTWWNAAEDAPEGGEGPIKAKRYVKVMPRKADLDLMTALLAGLAMVGICGTTWYLLETNDRVTSPWMIPILGVFIALSVRLGGGAGSPDIRALVSGVLYVGTLVGVAYFIERFHLSAVVGGGTRSGIERAVVERRLRDPLTMFCWALGLFLALQVCYLRPKRKFF